MEDNRETTLGFITDIVLIAGVVYLASQGKDGWGWLIFILFVKHG